MRKLLSLLLGLVVGAALGAVIVNFVAPEASAQLVSNIRRSYQETMQAARLASANRRAELEDELAQMQQRRVQPALPPGQRKTSA